MKNKILRLLMACLLVSSLWVSGGFAQAVPPVMTCNMPQPSVPVPQQKIPYPSTNLAAEAADFSINASGEIIGYTGTDSIVEIPDEISGIKVTSIGWGAFQNNQTLTRVVIPETVTRIGYLAFGYCCNLTGIELPESLTLIEGWAFAECSNLKNCDVPSGVTSIGECAFYKCSALEKLTLPDQIASIGSFFAAYCEKLESVNIPASAAYVDEYAFFDCKKISELVFPEGLTGIAKYAFCGCKELQTVGQLPSSLKHIDEFAFYGCEKMTAIVFQEGLTSIARYAFCGCKELQTVGRLPVSMKQIGEKAFAYCEKITRLEMADGIEKLEEASLPPNAVLVFGTNDAIREYALLHGMKFICDNSDTSVETFESIDEKINWVIANYVTPDLSEYEKALRLYNWLCTNVSYDYQWLNTNVSTTEYGVTEEGALLGGWAVCEGYAKAYILLLEAVDMKAEYVHGLGGDGAHAWVIARIDGNWYQFDPTWDEGGNGTTHKYFALTDEAMRYNHTQYVNKELVCDSYDANYEYVNGEYDALLTALTNGINSSIENGMYSGMIDVNNVDQPSFFWDGPSPYTVAYILKQKQDWAKQGRVDVIPGEQGFSFEFKSGASVVTDIQVFGMNKPDYAKVYLMSPGENVWLDVKTTPENIPVQFASSNSAVLAVDSTGIVTAVSEGKATLTITASNYSLEIDVTVDSQEVLFEKNIYHCSPGERLNPNVYILNDEAGDYKNSCTYLKINLLGMNCAEYAGYYPVQWDDAKKSWNYWFALDCLQPGAVTVVAEMLDDSFVSSACTLVIHSDQQLILPENVTRIEEEAFVKANAEEVILPDGVKQIGSRAFAECENLKLVHLPAGIECIAPDAFEDCPGVTLLCCSAYAKQFAQSNGLSNVWIE